MFSKSTFASLLTFICTLVFACGPTIDMSGPNATSAHDAGVSEPTPNFTDYPSACRLLSEKLCQLRVRCGDFVSSTDCTLSDSFNCQNAATIMATGRFAFKTETATSCYNFIKEASCNINLSSAGSQCSNIIEGTGTEGASCSYNSCLKEFYCDKSATCPGRCVRKIAAGNALSSYQSCAVGTYAYNGICQPEVPRGASCAPIAPSTNRQTCELNSICSATTQTCVERVASVSEGQSCSNSQCGLGLFCKNGLCLKFAAPGANCDSVTQCQTGAFCSSANVCISELNAGGSCTVNAQCANDGVCLIRSGSSTGSCTPRYAKIGQSCVGAGSPSCSEGYCTAATGYIGVCANKKSLTATCSNSSECGADAYCNGICSAKKSAGADCEYQEECVSGAYCSVSGCRNKFSPGAACNASGQCHGYCNDGICDGCN